MRLRRIADESTRQSRRVWRAEVVGPVVATEVLPLAAVAEPGAVGTIDGESMIAIGPEGGWTDEEVGKLEAKVKSFCAPPNKERLPVAMLHLF